MKKKLSFLLALVFVLTLAFNALPIAGAAPAHNHDADPAAPGYHWDCTYVPGVFTNKLICIQAEHTAHNNACYQKTCTASEHTHSSTCQPKTLSCVKEEHEHTWRCYNWLLQLKCGKVNHAHGDSCYTTATCPLTEHTHSAVGGSCYSLICATPLHTHSTSNNCYEYIAEHYNCVQERDIGSVKLTFTYGSMRLPVLFRSIPVTLTDSDGGLHTATTDFLGVATFNDIPTGAVSFNTITCPGLFDVHTYFGTPAGLTVTRNNTVSGSVNLIMCYDHVDVYKNGALLVDRQINNVSNGAPQSTAVTVSGLSGSYTIGGVATPLSFASCGDEWRATNLTLVRPDSVSLSCTLTDGSGNIYPFSHTYSGQAIDDAINACPANCPLKSGMDFTINEGYVLNTNTYTVTFKTEAGGTINGAAADITYSNITEGSASPAVPATAASTDHTFDGWYDAANSKVTSFPATVTSNAVYTAKWTDIPYSVTYTYVSGTSGMDLPNAIETTSAPFVVGDSATYTVGQNVTRSTPASTAYDVLNNDGVRIGTWNLTSWSSTSPNDKMVSGGITFTGTWTYTEALKYAVTYKLDSTDNPNYGSLPAAVSYYAGATVPVLALTTADTTNGLLQGSWTFSGWKNGSSSVGANFIMPAGDVTLTGSWTFTETGKFLVSYKINGVAPDSSSPDVLDDASHYPGTSVNVAGGLTTMETTKGTLQGKWTFNGWTTAEVTVSNGAFTVPSNAVTFTGTWTFTEYASFTINKVDESGKLILSSAAVFTLYDDPEMTHVYGTYNTGDDGSVTINGLAPGIYYLKETTAPAGYNATGTVWTVSVPESSEGGKLYCSVSNSGSENNVLVQGTLIVMNTKLQTVETGTLTIDKTVSGDSASGTEKFAITVTFTPGAPNFWNILGITAPAGATGGNGTYTVSLSANDTPVTFSNIPVGTTYTVSEAIASTQTGWTEGASAGKTGTITTSGASAVIANVFTASNVAGVSDSSGSNDSSGQGVAGATEKLPQTGGISPSTLLALLGLTLIAAGGSAFIIIRKKNHGKDN